MAFRVDGVSSVCLAGQLSEVISWEIIKTTVSLAFFHPVIHASVL